MHASDLFALCEEIGYFGREDQRASVVALDKLGDHLGRLLRKVLVKEVARGGEDLELKFTCVELGDPHLT